jgi:hypothetical protein
MTSDLRQNFSGNDDPDGDATMAPLQRAGDPVSGEGWQFYGHRTASGYSGRLTIRSRLEFESLQEVTSPSGPAHTILKLRDKSQAVLFFVIPTTLEKILGVLAKSPSRYDAVTGQSVLQPVQLVATTLGRDEATPFVDMPPRRGLTALFRAIQAPCGPGWRFDAGATADEPGTLRLENAAGLTGFLRYISHHDRTIVKVRNDNGASFLFRIRASLITAMTAAGQGFDAGKPVEFKGRPLSPEEIKTMALLEQFHFASKPAPHAGPRSLLQDIGSRLRGLFSGREPD